MIDELCLIGHPSFAGGADTEVYHQLQVWNAMGVAVHIIPTQAVDNALKKQLHMDRFTVIYHKPQDWSACDGLHTINFCSADFLRNLDIINLYARTTTFVNCMTWNFQAEIEGTAKELIDFHLYQTPHAMERVGAHLKALGKPYRPLQFVPYFDVSEFPMHGDRQIGCFHFGRISRADGGKYNANQLKIYEQIQAPVRKAGMIVGWDSRIERKVGKAPQYIQTYAANAITQQAFYQFCDAIVMSTETFENLPRVGFEAMASGSILVVDRRGGWELEVVNGETGWLCKDEKEMVYRASRVAFEADERKRMREAARLRVESCWGLEQSMNSWEQVFDAWESHR